MLLLTKHASGGELETNFRKLPSAHPRAISSRRHRCCLSPVAAVQIGPTPDARLRIANGDSRVNRGGLPAYAAVPWYTRILWTVIGLTPVSAAICLMLRPRCRS